jgi:hypothetical protein
MRRSEGTLLSTIVILLLLTNLSWMSWNVYQHAARRDVSRQFRLEVLHTNDMSGIGLFEAKTDQPIWTQFSENGEPVIENHFFRGKDVFDITLRTNHPAVYNVYFRGVGKSVKWWLNAGGSDTFTERIFYDTNGEFFRSEVWYDQEWQPVDRRDGKNGIIVSGQWHQLAFDTNGMWMIKGLAAASTNP